jgi:hypothetical protein
MRPLILTSAEEAMELRWLMLLPLLTRVAGPTFSCDRGVEVEEEARAVPKVKLERPE